MNVTIYLLIVCIVHCISVNNNRNGQEQNHGQESR